MSSPNNLNVTEPPSNVIPPTEEPIPKCEETLVPIVLQFKPVIDITVCKPTITLHNKAVCEPSCDPDL